MPKGRPIDEELIRDVHRRIVTGCDDDHCPPGQLRARDENVTFGRPVHRGADGGAECKTAFTNLCAAVTGEFRAHDALVQGLALHYHIGAMHPFHDGNGRTARALEALILQRARLKDDLFVSMSNYYYDEKTTYLETLTEVRANGYDHKHANKKLKAGRGAVGKAIVVGAKDRKTNHVSAAVVGNTDAKTLQGFVGDRAAKDATVYTDDHGGYQGMSFKHESVKHSINEYVNGMAHTNGIESFWALLKRGYHGTFHHISPKHLHRYVNEFATRHNMRTRDTEAMMAETVARMVGKRLMYKDLVAD